MKFLPDLGLIQQIEVKPKLDVKDRKILYFLSRNARSSMNEIAKEVGLSRDSITYRIKQLEKNKVIFSSRTIIDVSKLGYENFHIFITIHNPKEEVEHEIIKKIIALPYVRALLQFQGGYDFEIAVIARSVYDFDNILSEILRKIGDYLEKYDVFIITNTIRAGAFPNSFMKDFSYKREKTENKEIKFSIDLKDIEIINLIRENAQISLVDISRKVNLSADSISYRLKNLKEKKFILGYTPVINFSALGYSIHAVLLTFHNLTDKTQEKLKDFLVQSNHILWAVKMIGSYNILLYVCTKEEAEYHQTMKEIRNTFPEHIKQHDSLLAFAEYKYTYAPDCLFQGT